LTSEVAAWTACMSSSSTVPSPLGCAGASVALAAAAAAAGAGAVGAAPRSTPSEEKTPS
jgi:hypothetical protein